MPLGSRGRHRVVIVALALILLGRLAFALLPYYRPALAIANDTDRYVPIANGILAGTAYSWDTQRPGELLNTVGYPAFLAAVFGLLGRAPVDVAVAQLLITDALALALYLVLVSRLGQWPALTAALLIALDPLTLLWSLTILTEVVCAVLIGGAALALVAWRDSRRVAQLVLAGALLAAGCLVKPYVLLLAIVWTAAIILNWPVPSSGTGSVWHRLGGASAFLLPILLLTAPWFARNAILWKCPGLASVDRVTMRDYVAAKIVQETTGVSLAAAQDQLQAVDPGVCPTGSAKYTAIVLEHPTTYLRLHAAGTIPVLLGTSFDRWLEYFGGKFVMPDLWRPYMDAGLAGLAGVLWTEFTRYPPAIGLMLVLTAWQLLIYALAGLSFLALRGRPAAVKWQIAVFAASALILLLSPGQGGHERFRVPAQPILAILAAYGVSWAISRNRRIERAVEVSQ